MTNKVEKWVKGEIRVELVGGDSAKFINEALHKHINVSDLHWTSSNQLQFTINVEQFFELRKIVKPMGGKIRIINKAGFPFVTRLLFKRIWFAIGLALFFMLIGILSTFIWSIEVVGNNTIPTQTILQVAKDNGLYPLQSSFRLPHKDKLAKQLLNNIDGVNWIGIEHTGTKVLIKVVEMTLPEKREAQSYRHLIASNDAVITYMITNVGKPVVKEHMRVKKGDILISGIIGSERHSEIVVADGEVRGLVWYEYKAELPLTHSILTYTGEVKRKNYIVIGDRTFRFKNKTLQFEQSELTQKYNPLVLFNYELPFGILKETEYESRNIQSELSKEEAKQIALQQAKKRLLEKSGADSKVISENILHEELQNGKVVLRILFEVEQSIVQQKPIVQIQGD